MLTDEVRVDDTEDLLFKSIVFGYLLLSNLFINREDLLFCLDSNPGEQVQSPQDLCGLLILDLAVTVAPDKFVVAAAEVAPIFF